MLYKAVWYPAYALDLNELIFERICHEVFKNSNDRRPLFFLAGLPDYACSFTGIMMQLDRRLHASSRIMILKAPEIQI